MRSVNFSKDFPTKSDLKYEIQDLKNELKQEMQEIRTEIQATKSDILKLIQENIWKTIALLATLQTVIAGLFATFNIFL